MVILANDRKEIGVIREANISFDSNGDKKFSVQIARCNWTVDMTFFNYVYVPGTEFGGMISQVITSTALDYVELKGWTWRGRLYNKIIEPPTGSDYKIMSGDLHEIMRDLIEPEFDGRFVVSRKPTGCVLEKYQFRLRCHLLDGLETMLKSQGYKLRLTYVKEQGEHGYVLVEAVSIVDYSERIEMSQDNQLTFTMSDDRSGINHLIVAGQGELQERMIIHLYVQADGSIGELPYYTGWLENVDIYENTSVETEDELREYALDRFEEIRSRKTFSMDIESLGADVEIGDIVGGRDYLTGLFMAKPIANIIYNVSDEGEITKNFVLEGENDE